MVPPTGDRARRRITRALVEHVPDRRALVLLVPPHTDRRREAEIVFPRIQAGASGGSATSVRALLDLDDPTRFHRDLLRYLHIPKDADLLAVSRLWQRQFSIERVTTQFYKEYTAVRDRISDALKSHNADNAFVSSLSERDARAWSTRQMGRVLFLWFLQAKGWLGAADGQGSVTYLLDLWGKRTGSEYYRGVLVPLFFDAMATGSSSRGQSDLLGVVPYLNGGLFRTNALEDDIAQGGPVSLPDDVFDPSEDASLLGLLSRYRFTTQESTPDDQSVDPDPELLGRVFENLYQEVERHDSGTYYTPREIVHFMCREALDGYLRDKTGVAQDALNALRQVASGTWDDQDRLPNVPAASLIDALETVKVCDPAVGSGAFLLGAIQEIVTLRRGILLSQRSYVEPGELDDTVSKWKQRIIENNLYGVDINPEAVEICQLRLWLSMVLQMLHPPTPNSGWALPNLDFRIVAGDSLVDRAGGVTFKESWPPPTDLQFGMELHHGLQQLEEYIASRRSEFERTHGDPERLKELRNQIAGYQREVVRLHLAEALAKAKADRDLQSGITVRKNALRQAQARVDQLQGLYDGLDTADFTLVQKPFLWPIAFPDILKEGNPNTGFDIVLANPPYVSEWRSWTTRTNWPMGKPSPKSAPPRADILVYFYARALADTPSRRVAVASSPATSSCGLPTVPRFVNICPLPCASSGSSTLAICPYLTPRAKRLRRTRRCLWASVPTMQMVTH